MNRLNFLKELRNSLVQTTVEITKPFVEDEVEKIDQITSDLIGVRWIKLDALSPSSFTGVTEHYLHGKAIIIFSDGKTLKGYEAICDTCKTKVQILAYEQSIKCFNCDKKLDLNTETGDLACKRLYIKKKGNEWFIGV